MVLGTSVVSIEDFLDAILMVEMVDIDLRVHDCIFELRLFKIVNIVIFGLKIFAVESSMRMFLEDKFDSFFHLLPAKTFLAFNFHLHFNIIICGDCAFNTAIL